jgi:CHAT domain-containing protein/tetratricopeptide (TPR) repeat protein
VPAASRSFASDVHASTSPFGGFALIARDRYLLLAAVLVVLLNCVNTTGEYILSELVIEHVEARIALDPSLDKGALIAQFYSGFLFAVNALTVIAQLFIVGRVFRAVGVQGALLVLPVVALLGYVLVAFVPIFAILQVIKVVENAADYSITNTARHALYLPVPAHAKHESKIATDTFFWRFGDLLQGGIVFAGLNWFGFEIRHFAALNLVLAAVWVAVAWRLGKRYSVRTGTPCLASRVPAALRRHPRRWVAVPRAVLVRGATAWFAAVIGLAAVSASVPSDAGAAEVFSTPRTFAAPEHLCEALSESKHNPGVPLLRGSPLTDESFVERLRHATRALVFCTLSVSAPSHAQDAIDASVVILADGVPVTRSQHADEPLVYAFNAQHGQTLLIEVEQQGLDVIVSVQAPSGDVLRFNSPLQRSESELVLVEDAVAGRYRVTVVSEEPTNASGSHTISLSSLDALARRRYGSALREMSEGARANAESRFGDSLQHYQRASEGWWELAEIRRHAQAQYSEAMLSYWSLYDWRRAVDQAAAAAALYERLEARTLYANAVLTKGYSLIELAQSSGIDGERLFAEALSALNESSEVHEALGNVFDLAQAENFIGLAYFNRGRAESQDFRKAETHYLRAAELFTGIGEWREALGAKHNLALISIDEGYAARAVRILEEVLGAIPPGKDAETRGFVLGNLGVAYRDSGELDAALVALSESVAINASLKNVEFEAFALRALGTTYQALGELERAEEFLRQALEKAIDHGRVRAAILSGLGTVAYQKAEYEQALDWHEQSVAATTSTVDRAYRQGFVVRDLVALQRFSEAIARGNAVLSGVDTPAITRADAALELGHAYLELAQPRQADESFVMALDVYDAALVENKAAEALNGRALAARARGDLSAAIEFGEQSLQRIESLRARVSAPELRAFYSAAHSDYYKSHIESLVAAHRATGSVSSDYLTASLSVSERARGRMIVDLLGEAALRLGRDEAPEALLERERERELYDELAALRYQRDRLLEQPTTEPAQMELVVRRMAALENELSLSAMEARRTNSVRPSVGVAKTLDAAEIQASLDDRTVLLQYSLASRASYVWIATRDSLRVVELADRATIESAARRVYDDLKSYRATRASISAQASRDELAALVLAPVIPLVGRDHDRLIVASDGALGYVPFGVLPVTRAGDPEALLDAFEVSSVPSMSAVVAQRRRAAQPAPKTLAIFADPVFAAADPRLTTRGNAGTGAVAGPFANAPVRLERLPATGAEASAISSLVAQDSKLVLTGFDANREQVLNASLDDYRIVHFATHGLVDSRYPGLSALAFSQFDAAGRPLNGLLRLQDVYRLELNADFVVLSGCETALGREIRGEGLIGLVDGFLYAGARNLVVSLWQVPDRATAELMARFYGYVLRDSLRPAEALRQAQRSIASEPRWSDPYFWGAFVVLGDS